MDNIIEPNEHFQFSKLSLTLPSGIQGGAYFTKIQFNNKPLYIQTTKSQTRQGIVKTGKKYYCDLMFDKNSEELIQWFENLEECCQKLIFSKSESWFQTSLEISDIETAFNSPIRVYKSGKNYLLRVNIKTNTKSGEPTLKIYDENEISLGISDIHPETNIISILEIQGIKFTNRNFQIEIELKQMMVLNEPIFDNCLIKKDKKMETPSLVEKSITTTTTKPIETVDKNSNLESNTKLESILQSESENKNVSSNQTDNDVNVNVNVNDLNELESFDPISLIIETDALGKEKEKENSNYVNEKNKKNVHLVDDEKMINETNDITLLNENEINKTNNDSNELKEFNISVETNLDPITLKKPNEVYYELYKQARKKAKEAKKSAIIAYLEAKNIKKTYMLENLDDSDDEFDDDMEDLTENDIEEEF